MDIFGDCFDCNQRTSLQSIKEPGEFKLNIIAYLLGNGGENESY
jgi:hypothetical protein